MSGYAAIVAFGTGIGILRRQLWAWPVALASVDGFGPIVLVLVSQLPTAAVVAGFVLFLVDAVALLAIERSYFGAQYSVSLRESHRGTPGYTWRRAGRWQRRQAT